MALNIFIIGLEEFNHAQLRKLRQAGTFRFHNLLPFDVIKGGNRLPLEILLRQVCERLDNFPGSVDAVVGYWDFPVSTMLPLIRRRYGLPGPTLEAVLKCEHKYWSRRLQREIIPEMVPAFTAVDPFDDAAAERIGIDYPFWLKPVKAASSCLGFHVHDRRELERSLAVIREQIGRFAGPFNHILAQAQIPADIAAIDGNHCIAEALISNGRQCTLEGYVYHGEVTVYGIVDSIREGRFHSSFSRYQYPSTVPAPVRARMIDAITRLLHHIGYDNAPFNAEFYWSEADDQIAFLEVNTRISKSHAPLFRLVDGEYHHAVMIDVALGRRPDFPYREGDYRTAAKFMVRSHRDGRVNRTPSRDDIERVLARFPGSDIEIHVRPGMRLRDLRDQDSYSYEIAVIFLGADNPRQLSENYKTALDMLAIEVEEIAEDI